MRVPSKLECRRIWGHSVEQDTDALRYSVFMSALPPHPGKARGFLFSNFRGGRGRISVLADEDHMSKRCGKKRKRETEASLKGLHC